jgi:hypothetical protein
MGAKLDRARKDARRAQRRAAAAEAEAEALSLQVHRFFAAWNDAESRLVDVAEMVIRLVNRVQAADAETQFLLLASREPELFADAGAFSPCYWDDVAARRAQTVLGALHWLHTNGFDDVVAAPIDSRTEVLARRRG